LLNRPDRPADHRPVTGDHFLFCEGSARLLFTENETNNQRLFGSANPTPYIKDGINDFVVAGRKKPVHPSHTGTKAVVNYELRVGGGAAAVTRLRLSNTKPDLEDAFGPRFAQIVETRRREAGEFCAAMTPSGIGEDAANVMRQALAGVRWSKQHFLRCRQMT
jgi:hypothetical protein